MIQGFDEIETKMLWQEGRSRRWKQIESVALRKLAMLNSARELQDLKSPPGNELEPLIGKRKGQHSIRINGQWRICFRWTEVGPANVEIVDYHKKKK